MPFTRQQNIHIGNQRSSNDLHRFLLSMPKGFRNIIYKYIKKIHPMPACLSYTTDNFKLAAYLVRVELETTHFIYLIFVPSLFFIYT